MFRAVNVLAAMSLYFTKAANELYLINSIYLFKIKKLIFRVGLDGIKSNSNKYLKKNIKLKKLTNI